MQNILLILALALSAVSAQAIYADVQFIIFPSPLPSPQRGEGVETQNFAALLKTTPGASTFTSHMDTPEERNITVQTLFNSLSPTIEKRIIMEYAGDRFSYTITLEEPDGSYQQAIHTTQEGTYQLYYRDNETIAYSQGNDLKGDISLKEWIYTAQPNTETGTKYLWHFRGDTPNSFLTLKEANDGSVELYRSIPLHISGINPQDTKKRQHIIETVRKALGDKVKIGGDELIAKISRPIYWTKQGIKKTGTFTIINNNGLAVSINEPASSYPLLIDPTISWGQWLGGNGSDEILAMAVVGDEIYVGGRSQYETMWGESIAWQGAYSGDYEGFVIEIADGPTPAIHWGQWLGGLGYDVVEELVVNGDEIYAGGWSTSPTNWESSTLFKGAHTGTFQGFVVEIADNDTTNIPAIRWGWWLGGLGTHYTYALAVNGNEIYAGGESDTSWGWLNSQGIWTTPQGTFEGLSEGFVVEILDNDTTNIPNINWGQWLGGRQYDTVFALAVNSDEIYVGGASSDRTNWEMATFQGTHSGGISEGFVVEIADNDTTNIPAINWGQWLGGVRHDYVYTLAVNGNEIYAGGRCGSPTNWENITSFQGIYSGSQDEGFIVEIIDNDTTNIPAINWGQWLGGSDGEYVWALAVNGDKIYGGGWSTSRILASWESIDWQGAFSGGWPTAEGFFVEIADNDTNNIPTINWGQWLGGDRDDYVYAVVVNWDEIYAAGKSVVGSVGGDPPYSGWESVSWQGTYSGSLEGFLIKLLPSEEEGDAMLFLGPWF